MSRLLVFATAFAVLAPVMSNADNLNWNGVTFETATPQSMWTTGDAFGLQTTVLPVFDDPEWTAYEIAVEKYNAEMAVRLAEAEATNVRNLQRNLAFNQETLTYNLAIAKYNAVCRGLLLAPDCNNPPEKPIRPTLENIPDLPKPPVSPDQTPKSLSGTAFLGGSWEKSDDPLTLGFIAGDPSTAVPNPALALYAAEYAAYGAAYTVYQAKLGAYKACKALPFGGCGKRPKKPKAPAKPPLTVNVSTETGAEATINSSGKLGFDFKYTLDSGSLDAEIDYDIAAILPDAMDIKAGEAFSINGSSNITGGDLETRLTQIEAGVDVVVELNVDASGRACFVGECASGSTNLVDIEEQFELFGADATKIRILGDEEPDNFSIPGKLELSWNPGAAQTESKIFYDLVTGQIVSGGVAGSAPSGAFNELAKFTIGGPPTLELEGGFDGTKLVASGASEDPFVAVKVDLDGILSRGAGVPLGVTKNISGITTTLEALDLKAGPSLGVYQDFEVTTELMVEFLFDQLVEINGDMVMSYSGYWDSLPEFAIFRETTFMPEFSLAANAKSDTGLVLDLGFELEFLKASIDFKALTYAIGPAFDIFDIFPGLNPSSTGVATDLSLFNNDFAMTGFNSFMGESFVLAPYSSTGAPLTGGGGVTMPDVPLPATIWLLLGGLGMLGLKRRGRNLA